MIALPNQRVSRSEKQKDSFYKPTYDHIIAKAISMNPKEDLIAWLNCANGVISNESLNYLVSPLLDKETKKTVGKLPGEIRDTDFVTMVRERNMGEYVGLPYKFTVTVNNADAILKRDAKVNEEVNKLMQQTLINMLNEYYGSEQQTGTPSKEVPDIEVFAKKFINEWIDDRAINGLNILKLINDVNDFDTKRIQAFFYWWACEEFYTYREIINNEVYTNIISPLEGYPIYNDEQFVEDYTGFMIKRKTTLTKIKSLYWNKLNQTEKDYIEGLVQSNDGQYKVTAELLSSRLWNTEATAKFTNRSVEYDVTDPYEAIDEYITIWRTDVPIKIRRYIDPFGTELEEVVSPDYIPLEGIDVDIREEWIEEIYVGRRFGGETTGIYLPPEPCDVQRYDKHTMNPKLPVGGKKGILRNIKQNPIPKRLISFVIIDRMLMVQQERTMAKYQAYIQIIPKSMMNDDIAGTKNEKMFYIKADNTLYYDDSSVDFNTVAQGFRVVGMPDVANYLKTLIELRAKYKAEGLEIANMNDYALGDVMASTGKGVMDESIFRARIGNVVSITMFNATLERDHMADLEFSKIAYHGEKRGSYLDKRTGKTIYVDINLEQHPETDYGVHVENSKLDQDKITAFKQLGFNASQNGDIAAATAVITYDSVPELREALQEIDEANKKLEAAMEENRNATQKYVADQQTARQNSINETTKYVADKNSETAITVAEMKIEGDATNIVEPDFVTTNNDNTAFQREQLDFKKQDAAQKNLLKEKQIRSTNQNNADKLKLAKSKPKAKQ